MPFLGLVLAACAASGEKGLAFSTVASIQPGADDAVVAFYHPFGLSDLPVPASIAPIPGATGAVLLVAPSALYQIWTPEGLAALFPAGCTQVRVKPGRQIFVGRFVRWNAGNWTVLEGELEGGKTYFVKVSQRWNTWKPALELQVVRASDFREEAVPCNAAAVAYDHASQVNGGFWQRHEAQNAAAVRTVYEDLRAGRREYYFDRPIVPQDGR